MGIPFQDCCGMECEIIPGFAQTVFSGGGSGAGAGYRQSEDGNQSQSARISQLEGVGSRVRLGTRLLDSFVPTSAGGTVLVVGASTGGECAWIADSMGSDPARVLGSNLTENPLFGAGELDAFASISGDAARAERVSNAVELIVDDITRSELTSSSFDRVYSWQTLEHVMDPAAGFRHIARVLRPGGAAFIEYNPFFSIDGAHWPATIDIPWAHARLDDAEFERAVFSLHTDRQPDAAEFVRRAINRTPQLEMLQHAQEAGLQVIGHLPRVRTEDSLQLTREIVEGVLCRFPRATVCDLTSRIVRLILRKPDV